MRRMAPYTVLLTAAGLWLLAAACGSDSGPAAPSVVATEIWTVDLSGGQGSGDLKFIKQSNGIVTAIGNWTFGTIFCPFLSGPGAVSDSTIAFSGDGVATNNAVSSHFSASVQGKAGGGHATGNYAMVFSQGWQVPSPLTWTATRTSGSGITP